MAKAKDVVPAETAVTEPAPPSTPETPTVPDKKTVAFVKNINPQERITFKDGSHFIFPNGKALFVTADEQLIDKINQVAAGHGIVTQ